MGHLKALPYNECSCGISCECAAQTKAGFVLRRVRPCAVQGVCRMSTSRPCTTHLLSALKHLQELNKWFEELVKKKKKKFKNKRRLTNPTDLHGHRDGIVQPTVSLGRSLGRLC